jgi:hypothetical protein
MAVQQLHDGNDEGANFGASTSQKIGFYGLTAPIVQGATITAISTSDPISVCGGAAVGFSATQGAAIIANINSLISRLQALNLIAT